MRQIYVLNGICGEIKRGSKQIAVFCVRVQVRTVVVTQMVVFGLPDLSFSQRCG